MSSLSAKWKEASFFKKFVLVNLVIPWTPIVLLIGGYFAPPEVMNLVETNGKLVGAVAGTSFELASAFFKTLVFGM